MIILIKGVISCSSILRGCYNFPKVVMVKCVENIRILIWHRDHKTIGKIAISVQVDLWRRINSDNVFIGANSCIIENNLTRIIVHLISCFIKIVKLKFTLIGVSAK